MDLFSPQYYSVFFGSYQSFTKDNYRRYFFAEVDAILLKNLPIEYEFKFENVEKRTNVINYAYVEDKILPMVKKLTLGHKMYLEIEVIQLLQKRQNYNFEKESEKYLVFEKEFEILRSILMRFLITEFIDNGSIRRYKGHANYITHGQGNDSPFGKETKYNNEYHFNLGEFVNYFYQDNQITYTIQIKFIEFLKAIQSEEDKEAVCFWFLFFIPSISDSLSIAFYDYEYFAMNNIDFNFFDSSYKFFLTLNEYMYFNKTILKLLTRQIEYVCLHFYDNYAFNKKMLNMEVFRKLWEDNKDNNNHNHSHHTHNKVLDQNLIMGTSLKFNTLVINTYGKLSKNTTVLQEFLSDQIKFNTVPNIFINFFNFNDFEFSILIKENMNYIEETEEKFINLVEILANMIGVLETKGLSLLQITVEGFSSHKSYWNSIMNKFEIFLNEVFRLFYFKNSNFLINFNDLNSAKKNTFNEYETLTFCDHVWKFYLKNSLYKVRKVSQVGNQSQSEKNVLNLSKMSKVTNQNFITHFNILEADLKILENKEIDLYIFKNLSLKSITHLRLGYFRDFEDVVVFLSKLDLSNFPKLQKINLYCNSNKGLTGDNLNKFFNELNWPKSDFKSLKVFYENFSYKKNFNIFDIYHKIMSKRFIKNSSLSFVGFIRIENHLMYKINSQTLTKIANEIPLALKKKENLISQFFFSTYISEYFNWKKITPVVYAVNRGGLKVLKMLNREIKNKEMSIIQYLVQFLKSRRVLFQDFSQSSEIFERFEENMSKDL